MVTYWYTVLPSNQIINLCGPEHDPLGWTPEIIEERKKKTEHRVMYTNNKKGFFTRLEKSILEDGIANPIIVVCGLLTENHLKVEPEINHENLLERIHPNLRESLNTLLTCPRNGGSRLYLAQKHGLDVPCVVNDFTGQFNDGRQLLNKKEILECYNNKPANLEVNEAGMFITGLPHIHMVRDNGTNI